MLNLSKLIELRKWMAKCELELTDVGLKKLQQKNFSLKTRDEDLWNKCLSYRWNSIFKTHEPNLSRKCCHDKVWKVAKLRYTRHIELILTKKIIKLFRAENYLLKC